MFEFKLPDLGEGIHEGEILKWHVGPGDAIVEDESLVEVETDKAAVTLPSPRSGRVVSVTGKPGDVVKVGQVIAVIEDGSDVGRLTSDVPGQEAGRAAVRGPGAGPREPGSLEAKSGAPGNDPAVQTSDIGRQASDAPVPATPATRRLARELGVDLRQVPPTGKAGRVTSDDVRRFKAAEPSTVNRQPSTVGPGLSVARTSDVGRQASDVPEPPPWTPGASPLPLLDLDPLPDFALQGPVEIEPLRSIRRRTARRMVTSMTLIPMLLYFSITSAS